MSKCIVVTIEVINNKEWWHHVITKEYNDNIKKIHYDIDLEKINSNVLDFRVINESL